MCILVFYNYLANIYLKKQYQQINITQFSIKVYFSLVWGIFLVSNKNPAI
nr:MAG TPA: hypothetical protein [Caudoviricetes sp.]DAP86582.1 MAG TPA: hypothetical protein [Caudoviricetes sp.]DAT18716.1 MAG TPA: hypothetical protein [Caudoviricetes sp.]